MSMSPAAAPAEELRPAPDEPEAYEAPCVVDVDTESQPAATAAMIATNPG